jgi:transposase-like protein
MAASNVSPEIRAAAIADLLSGDAPAEVARRYGIDSTNVRQWKARYVTSGVTDAPVFVTPDVTLPTPQIGTQHEIGRLLLDLLAAKLKASHAIAEAASDPGWLATQSAADLAQLGEYLDRSAFSLGDRLATSAQQRAESER